jgi:hypothetical protein
MGAPVYPANDSPTPFFSTRLGRDRQLTSRRAWRRGLPQAIDPALLDNANDNRPLSRRPAKRSLSLRGLLEWTYRQQRAHQILRESRDWFLWAMDAAGYIDVPHDRRQVHHDAAIVHEAVLSLGTEDAALIIEMAVTGMWPEPIEDLEPRFYPMEPPDKFEEFGRHVRSDGTRFIYWIKTIETIAIRREEYELAGRRKMQRAKADSWERVPVRYCPVYCDPEPEFVEMMKRRAEREIACSRHIVTVLVGAPFRDTVLVADNDNVPQGANDNDEAVSPLAASADTGSTACVG